MKIGLKDLRVFCDSILSCSGCPIGFGNDWYCNSTLTRPGRLGERATTLDDLLKVAKDPKKALELILEYKLKDKSL